MNCFLCFKFLQSRFLLYCVVCLFVLKIITIGFFINFPLNIFFADITKITLNNLINQNREALGLQSLAENEKLNQAAELKAKDMVEKGYFSHQSPDGTSPWFWFKKAGYNYKYAGENIAIGFLNSNEVYRAWFDSPSHKNNFLNPNYKEMGIAVLGGFGENNAIVVVQLFASPSVFKVQENLPYLPDDRNIVKEGLEKEDFLNFAIYDYEAALKSIIYGFLALITGALFVWLFYGFNIQHKNILFRSVVFIILLSLAALVDNELLLLIIPHQIII